MCPTATAAYAYQLPAPIVLLLLPVDQPGGHIPLAGLPPDARDPLAEMRGQSVEGVIETISAEEREAARR